MHSETLQFSKPQRPRQWLANSAALRQLFRATRVADAAAMARASSVTGGAHAARDRGVLHPACRRRAGAATTLFRCGGGTRRRRQQREARKYGRR